MSKIKPKLVVIVGPTASGKTSLSLALAGEIAGEIISADSRQVYSGLNIGTEKITDEETLGIPHHLINCASPEEVYTIADWKQGALEATEEIIERGHVPMVVGGTFFYIEALLGASFPEVAPNPKLRKQLETLSADDLFNKLKSVDPERAETIDPKNPRRLVRALEIADAIGATPPLTREEPFDAFIIGIKRTPDVLKKRIAVRLKETLKKGLVEETKKVLRSGISEARLREIGLEYRVALEYIAGGLTDEQFETKLNQKVWQYAKRQVMWLKKMKDVHWYEASETERITRDVKVFLKN